MGINRRGSNSPRNALRSSASLLGLAAGGVGWSGLAQAAGEETTSQMMLLPEHYELMENGVVVFKLETGENLSLTADQYLILEDGLLLITDELAQASIYSLPVMGSVRAQLLTDLEQVATIDGTVAEATPAQTLSITEGQAPRLSEQVELQSYELAQKSECEDGSDNDDEGCALPLGVSSEASGSEGLAVGMSVAPGAMALLGMLMTSDQPADEEETPGPAPTPPAPPCTPEFWTDADVGASTSITGTSCDSFIGYTAASTTATTDPLTTVGYGFGTVATFDMSAGGNNYFVAAASAAGSSGTLSYTGGSGDDSLTFGTFLAFVGGNATFNMSAGGNNTLLVGIDGAASGGVINYTGGSGVDSLTFGDGIADGSGRATLDLGNDAASETVTFQGKIGGSGIVTIQNFKVSNDQIDVPTGVSAVTTEISSSGAGNVDLTWTDSGNNHTVTFAGLGPGGSNVALTALTAAII